MSLTSWLQSIRSALAPRRDRRKHTRPASLPSAMYRPGLEALEDRCLLSLTPGVPASVGGYTQAADFNNDGQLDLATVTGDETSSTISVVLGNGDGTFQQPARTSAAGIGPADESGPYSQSLAVGDFNDDSALDLAIAVLDYEGLDNDVRILLGNGDGTFDVAAPVVVWSAYLSNYVATGDLDADGTTDLVITSSSDPYGFLAEGAVSIRLGSRDGALAHAATYASADIGLQFFSPVLADFNRDGSVDVAVPAMSMPPGGQRFFLRVFLGNGDGTLRWSRDVDCDPIDSAAVGDFNMDGKADVVGTSTLGGDTVTLLLGNGDGSFQAARRVADTAMPFAPGDVNGDSRLDLVTVRGGDLNVYLGNGDGAFAPVAITTGATYLTSIVLADFNADGRPDAVVTNGDTGAVSVMLNDGDWSSPPPSVTIGDATVTEGNTGTVNAIFMLTLSQASNADVTVHYDTANTSAVPGSDYTAASGDVIIPAGRTSATFTVEVISDRLAEPNETFVVNLSSPINMVIADGHAVGTIVDDDPRISISDVSKSEGRKNKTTLFTFTVTLSAAYDQAVTLSYRTVYGTATTGDSDYVAKTGTLTFAPGETTKTITIEVKGDSKQEANETFNLDLIAGSGNSLFTKNRGIGTILNDD